MKLYLGLALICLPLMACKDKEPDPILLAGWFDVYGGHCGETPTPGCNYYKYDNGNVVKIKDSQDPFYSSSVVFSYQSVQFSVLGVTQTYEGFIWVSESGIIYDVYGKALNQVESLRGRDIVSDVATQEEEMVLKAGKSFSERHGITLEKGIQIAKNLNQFAQIGTSRARTEQDVLEFSSKLYGIPMNEFKTAQAALLEGDQSKAQSIISQAAQNWGISEEHMKSIVKNWYGFSF